MNVAQHDQFSQIGCFSALDIAQFGTLDMDLPSFM